MLLAPFTWLPQTLAEGVFVAVSWRRRRSRSGCSACATGAATGWCTCGRRCVGTFLAGALSTLLALAVAVGWRWRRSALAFGGAIAGAAVAKLFLWPLLVLCATAARWRAGIVAIVVACIAVLASWALIGFAGLAGYPRLLQHLSHVETPRGYSPTAFALALGLPTSLALVVAVAVGLPLLFAAARLVAAPGRRAGRAGVRRSAPASRSRRSSGCTTWFCSIVPIAVARDRLGPVWFVPLLFWLSPSVASNGTAWEIALAIGVTTLTLALAAAPGRVLRTAR